MTKVAPISLSQLPDGWLADRREIIARDGHDVRADGGAGIEVSARDGAWLPLMLHGGSMAFASREDRDVALASLKGAA